ncbi:MAG: insulinase family protein [Tannerella sp.]|jgi:predicted Zn-dependent peptidase|nr:insulinase family protein [Tannerella sp.]
MDTPKAQMFTDVKEYTLDNGLTVWLNEDHNQPKVFGAVVVKAGSKDCPNTGIAHYFEHMMFKGTDKIGTVDYAAEKVWLDAIALKYDELAQTKDSLPRRAIQQEINELSVRAARYVIPNEFDKLITKYGGSKLNAGTSYDYTVYHNIFSPQYMAHWAEINSERLLNPVFRMFQSELETVYEEKNRRNDMMLNQAIEKLMEIYFQPHPYAYPVIGSTENLKNPRLSEMRKFFEEYYVASNMGLILSGDFEPDSVLPILRHTFSRIPKGTVKSHTSVKIPPFRGREKTSIKVPIPLMKAVAIGFRGVPSNHPDQAALDIAVGILNNSNSTGYLDKLMVNRKVMGAMVGGEAFNEAGFVGIVVVPKLVSQTCRSAEKMIWREVERLKKGDFTDEIFNSLKQDRLHRHFIELEDIDSRSQVLVRLFSQGKTWADYQEDLERTGALSKEDVVKVANKYFGDNYLFAKKKTGRYSRENLSKPDFAPILPTHTDATSAYGKQLGEIRAQEVKPRFVDFEKDVQMLSLTPKVTLYVTPNRMNTIFTLKFSYGIGLLEQPKLKHLTTYIPILGTESQSFEAFRMRLQTLGSTLDMDVDEHCFTLKISGFDKAFGETLALICDFLVHVKVDDKKLKTLVDDAKVTEKAFFKSNNEVADALFEYVQYGRLSQYMTKSSYKDVKKIKGSELVAIFHQVQQVACNLHYCGTLEVGQVAEQIKQMFAVEQITEDSHSPVYREFVVYDRPLVFFYDMPDVFQNIIYAYMACDPLETLKKRHEANLFSKYFGEGMSSLMFQEIREFRSFAYYTSGAYRLPPFCQSDKPTRFVTCLSTQSDKTTDALKVLNSLIQHMPEHPEKIEAAIQTTINHTNNEYPSFREISMKIASYRRDGYTEDPNLALLNDIKQMEMKDIVRFYRSNVKGRTLVYVVVGNSRKIDMRQLAAFGDIVRMKKRDFYH